MGNGESHDEIRGRLEQTFLNDYLRFSRECTPEEKKKVVARFLPVDTIAKYPAYFSVEDSVALYSSGVPPFFVHAFDAVVGDQSISIKAIESAYWAYCSSSGRGIPATVIRDADDKIYVHGRMPLTKEVFESLSSSESWHGTPHGFDAHLDALNLFLGRYAYFKNRVSETALYAAIGSQLPVEEMQYDASFSSWDGWVLRDGIPSSVANSYVPIDYPALDLCMRNGVSPGEYRAFVARSGIHRPALIMEAVLNMGFTVVNAPQSLVDSEEKITTLRNYNLISLDTTDLQSIIATGREAIIFLYSTTAVKLSPSAKHERAILEVIRSKVRNLQNIVRLSDVAQNRIKVDFNKDFPGIGLELIKGPTLEAMVKAEGLLESEVALSLLHGVAHGLYEMQCAGILQHRDLRPANIVVSDSRRPVLIDFSLASRNSTPFQGKNRRFGGPSDITSLGQMLYHAVTGHHIFAESQSMSLTMQADAIADVRTRLYDDSDLLERVVREKTEPLGERIGDAVSNLLLNPFWRAERAIAEIEHAFR